MTAHRAPGAFCSLDLPTRDAPASAEFPPAAPGWTFAVDPDDWRQATTIRLDGHRLGGVSDLGGGPRQLVDPQGRTPAVEAA